MSYTGQTTSAWDERMRLIRLRRKKERPKFWTEFMIIPKWLIGLVAVLYVVALVIAILVNLSLRQNQYGNQMFPWELRHNPALASLAMAGAVTGVALVVALMLFMLGYVNQDAKRRGMNSTLWTLLVLILSPVQGGIIGFIIYLLVRDPLPYPCPRCAAPVGPRFNFCPSCQCNLYPSCPNCKREIAETDKFCPYCANDLKPATLSQSSVS